MAHPAQDRRVDGREDEPEVVIPAQRAGTTPPRTPTEDAVAGIWRDVLDRGGIGVHDSFFDLGANSLHTIQVVSRIRKTLGVDIPVREFFRAPTVEALAAAVAAGSSSARRVVGRRGPDAEPMLSFDQERLWLDSQLLPASAYNVHGRRRLLGPLDAAALDRSVRAVVARHETLRSRFPVVSGRPVHVVDDVDDDWHIRVEDVSGDDGDRAEAARLLADEQAGAAFDLSGGPLLRCALIRIGDDEHLFSVTLHHIISDAWSIGLFVRELSALYAAGGDVAAAALPELSIQYRDYAVWQRELLSGETLDREIAYWSGHLAGAPPALALPAPHRLAPTPAAVGGRIRSELTAATTTALRDFCRKQGVTPFMTLMAALATVLSRWTGQRDLVIGAPVATRADVGTDTLIGFFVNTLPLRIDLSGDPTFRQVLGRVRTSALDGYAHTDAPFDMIVKNLPANRDPRRSPVFQVILNVIGSPEPEEISGVTVEPVEVPVPPSKFDLTVTAREVDGALRIETAFNATRYESSMVELLVEHLHTLLEAVLADPGRGILDYPLAVGTAVEQPAGRPAPYAAALHNGGPAVIDGDGTWTYPRLAAVTGRVAAQLAEQAGGGRVGVVRRPTAGFVAVVLGCVAAGLEVTVVEPDAQVAARYLGISTLLDAAPPGAVPDGTLDLSGAVSDTVGGGDGPGGDHVPDPPRDDWAVEAFRLRAGDRVAMLAGSSGLLVSALSSACLAGSAVAVPPGGPTSDVGSLLAWLRTVEVGVLFTTPPMLRAITAHAGAGALPALRCVVVENDGGLLSPDVSGLRRWAPESRCVGVYRVRPDGRPGAVHAVPGVWLPQEMPLRVPLGTAGSARLEHPGGRPAAAGEVAEIHLDGQPTGDLGRRRPDGLLEFVGADPGGDPAETTAVLRRLEGVQDVLVTDHVDADGETVLVAYVAGAASDAAALRTAPARQLPEHLVPRHVITVPALPLTPLGAYDVDALPEPDEASAHVDLHVAPRTPIERQLVDILQELLGLDRIGVHDTFFDLGAFSLLVTRLMSRVRELFDVELSLRDVFEAATVGELAQVILRAQVEQGGIDDLEALLGEIESETAPGAA